MEKIILFREEPAVWRIRRAVLLLFCICVLSFGAIAQEGSVRGKVTYASGEPIPGVTVLIKGSSNGTTTDVEGKYVLGKVDVGATLVFSFIGLKTTEVPVGKRSEVSVTLEEESGILNEVVVVGYGEVNRRDLTGSVARANITDMVKAPVASFDDALAGRVAGVQVSSNDGQPGSLPNIVIRGANSLTQDNSPLYVIDGFPIEGNDNSAINPSDIASIDILKDASATAIYGARGANGVIVITTKRGQLGAPSVTYDTYFGVQRDVKRIETMSPYEFVKLQLEKDRFRTTEAYLTGQDRTLDDYKNIRGVDWYDQVLRTALMQNHNLSVSGGTAKSKYSVSGSYLGQQGIFVNTGFHRYQGRVTLDQTFNPRLKAGLNLNYANTRNYGTIATNNGGSSSASLMYSIWGYRPVFTEPSAELLDEIVDPVINPTEDYRTNPLLQLKNELRERISGNILANAFIDYAIWEGLKLRITGGVSNATSLSNVFNNSKTRTGNPTSTQYIGINGSRNFGNSTSFTNENTLSWSRTIDNAHTLNIVTGYTQQYGKRWSHGANSVNISEESLGLHGLSTGTPTIIQSSGSVWALQSFLARVNYDYKSRYLLTASMRADASSKFAKTNRWAYFPSIALAYRLSSEEFMKDLDFVSDAKIRASYGTTGNNRVDDFAYLSSIVTNASSGYPFGNTTPARGSYSSGLGNPELKWETTRQFNTGLDIDLWNDRIVLTADYYYKRTDDLLLNAQLPYTTGYNTSYKNIGSVSNSGVELSLSTMNLAKSGFRWNSAFNISFNRNKILSLTENQEALTSTVSAVINNTPVYLAKVGHPIALFYGVVSEGLYQYDDFNQLTNGAYVLREDLPTNGNNNRATILPGHARYRDLNNDGLISLNDYTIIGNPNPAFIGGFNNNFEYKGFDANIFFQFSYGNEVLNANRLMFEGSMQAPYNTNHYASYANRWTVENPTGDMPRVNGHGAGVYSSRLIEDGSFLRLKTLSLGYRLPDSLLDPIRIKSVRFYVSAQNLLTWTRYSGVDPEVSTRHTTLTPGFDYSPYPRMRTVILGLNVTF